MTPTFTRRSAAAIMTWLCLALLVSVAAAAAANVNETSSAASIVEQQTCNADLKNGEEGSCVARNGMHNAAEQDATASPSLGSESKNTPPPPQCNLYFAPSTLPDAGWGLFTARGYKRLEYISASTTDTPDGDYDEDEPDFEDIIIPILDSYKTFPFRGAQRFLPWLAYVWPSETGRFFKSETKMFPQMEPGQFKVDEGLSNAGDFIKWFFPDNEEEQEYHVPGGPKYLYRMNALTPGLALQVNSHDKYHNVFLSYKQHMRVGYADVIQDDLDMDDTVENDLEEEDDPFLQSTPRSYFHHGGLQAHHDIPPGSELFMFYGKDFHAALDAKSYSNQDFETLDDYMKRMDFSNMNTEADKRWLLNTTSMTLRTDENASFALREGDLGATIKRFERKFMRRESPNIRPTRSPEWLAENGVCVDQLTMKESNIPNAGHGAFSKHGFAKGQVVSHAPLLALRRDELVIYDVKDKNRPGINGTRQYLDKETVLGEELMKNYCFGHANSDMLLFPYSPVVNYINHDGENPNTVIRWTDESQSYLDMHPIDVMEQHGGTLRMEYVALREIAPGEEITIDYGSGWSKAWEEYQSSNDDAQGTFRHEISVPDGFYPEKWLDVSVNYEIVERGDLKPGELQAAVWKHNGQPFTRFAHRVGLPEGISQRYLEFSQDIGVVPTYDKLLKNRILGSDEWYVFNATNNRTSEDVGQWFAQRYKSDVWHFNMHYLAAWDEKARQTFLGEVGKAGFDVAMDGIGNHFGLDNMTCFHLSYMGVSECDKSFTHTDVYATGDVSFNMIWPILLVDGSKPELNLQSDDGNIVVAYKYEYDTAILMGDWGYHYTSEIEGYKEDEKRVVVGMYCGEINDKNAKMFAHLYDGEDPAPFLGQFDEPYELHWSKGNPEEHRLSR
ncbi:MAG: hypothetical protein SGILL_003832, partial [Bacillariaceae sp.]